MNSALLIPLTAIVITFIAALFAPKSKLVSGFLIAVFLVVGLFSVFGFLASFEPMDGNAGLIWKLAYAALFASSAFGIGRAGRNLFIHEKS